MMRWCLGCALTLLVAGWVVAQQSPTVSSSPTPSTQSPLLFLFRDDKAFRVGDVVTVLVTQTAVAAATSQTQSQKQVRIQTQAGSGVFSFIPSAGLQHQGAFATQAQERKNLSVITTIACRVVEISPTGLLRIEGSQEFTIDKRKQTVKLSGWVRPQDISPNNTVLSTQVADARLEFKGDWKTRQGKNLLERIVEGFNRILRALF